MQRLANAHASNAKNYRFFESKRKYIIQIESFDLYPYLLSQCISESGNTHMPINKLQLAW